MRRLTGMMAQSYRGRPDQFYISRNFFGKCIDPTIYMAVVQAYEVSYSFLVSPPNVNITVSESAIDRNQ